MTMPRKTDIATLVDRYDVLFLDAYGVLVDFEGTLPGARELIAHLNAIKKPFFILTNDASRTPQTSVRRYQERGLAIPPGRVITSGLLLGRTLRDSALQGKPCAVLGPRDSLSMVREAGGEVLPFGSDCDVEAVILCDEQGFDLRAGLDWILSLLYRQIDRGRTPRLILPNPDLIYPAGEGRYGYTAGAMALLLEEALVRRYPDRADLGFERLGKPHPPLFREALRRAGTDRAVMIGDQLETDIRGAIACGIESALVLTGLTRRLDGLAPDQRPNYLLESLAL